MLLTDRHRLSHLAALPADGMGPRVEQRCLLVTCDMPKESITESTDSAIPATKQYRLCLPPWASNCGEKPETTASGFILWEQNCFISTFLKWHSCCVRYGKLPHVLSPPFHWHLIFLYLWIIPFYFSRQRWVFIYVKFMLMGCCVWLFVCISCNGQSCPSFLTWGDWFSLDLSALPFTHVVRCNRACTSQTTWSLLQWRSRLKRWSWNRLASLRGIV